jgi:hypothetical protein
MRSFIAIVAAIAALSINPAFAEEASGKEAVRIEMDQSAKAFIFIIDDQPVAMLDTNGLRVVENIEYGHTLTDTGPDWIKSKIASRGMEAADD